MTKLERYFTRTVQHIHRVQNNMVFLVTNCEDFAFSAANEVFKMDIETRRQLMFNVMKHDQSKFGTVQFEPYVELTEYYHQRKALGNKSYEYPTPGIKEAVDAAVQDHYFKENHHPERMKGKALKMPFVELVEVVCDLQAMAQEFDEGSCRGYFEDVWVNKQSENFYDDWDWEVTKGFMKEIIGLFEKGGSNVVG